MEYLSKINLKRLKGRTCLLRIDLNIDPKKESYFRIDAILGTMKLLLRNGIKIVVLSHRGRPRGENKKLSLMLFKPVFEKKLKKEVFFLNNPLKNGVRGLVKKSPKSVFLAENLRFWPGEETNSPEFAKKLAILGDFYVDEAFPVSHRKNASISAITRFLPSYLGLRFEEEIKQLSQVLGKCKKPLVIIVGGAKASDKLGVINNFWNKCDYFLIGGVPANTFFAAENLPIGDSIFDKEAFGIIKKYSDSPKIILPIDVKIGDNKILDIGGKTISEYVKVSKRAGTVVWSGPVGLFEKKGFEDGTKGIWRAILSNRKAKIVVGGGETIASLKSLVPNAYRLKPKNIFLSTGGGAMLEFLSGKKLPGIEALKKSNGRK